MLIEIDESYQEPETPNEKIMHAICWDGKTVAEAATFCEVTEDRVLEVIAAEFKFTINKLRQACAKLREIADE